MKTYFIGERIVEFETDSYNEEYGKQNVICCRRKAEEQ